METILSMPLPMALALMVASAIAVYTFLNLIAALEETFRPLGKKVVRQTVNSSRAVAQ